MKRKSVLFLMMCLLPLSVMAEEYTDKETQLVYEIQTWDEITVAVICPSPLVSGTVDIPSRLGGYRVSAIKEGAFEGNAGIKSVSIPSGDPAHGNLTLGLGCFKDCKNLKKVEIGSNVYFQQYIYPGYGPYMGQLQFEGCTAIEYLYTDSNLASVGIPVDNLKTLEFGDHVTAIWNVSDAGDGVQDMVNLEKLTIGKNVKTIGEHSFRCSAKLGAITFPEGLETIGAGAFEKCSNLTFTLPKSLKKLDGGAFCDCTTLTSVTIPGGVERIEDMAFAGCYKLESLTVEAGVTDIGKYTFGECIALEEINLPEGLLWIDASAFANCHSLTEITIPSTVEEISEGAFANTSLTSVVSFIKEPFGIESRVFENENEAGEWEFTTATLFVPSASVDKYRKTYAWSRFSKIEDMAGGANGITLQECEPQGGKRYYTLDGRQLSAKPTAPGVYVVGGKKVVCK